MFKKETFIAIFWVLVGFAICYESFYLQLGALSRPGAGFITLITGGMIGLLGLILLFKAILPNKDQKTKEIIQVSFNVRAVASIVLALVAYTVTLKWLGYLICTVLLILYLLLFSFRKKESRPCLIIGKTMLLAIFVALVSYLLFGVWLKCLLPKGILAGIF